MLSTATWWLKARSFLSPISNYYQHCTNFGTAKVVKSAQILVYFKVGRTGFVDVMDSARERKSGIISRFTVWVSLWSRCHLLTLKFSGVSKVKARTRALGLVVVKTLRIWQVSLKWSMVRIPDRSWKYRQLRHHYLQKAVSTVRVLTSSNTHTQRCAHTSHTHTHVSPRPFPHANHAHTNTPHTCPPHAYTIYTHSHTYTLQALNASLHMHQIPLNCATRASRYVSALFTRHRWCLHID